MIIQKRILSCLIAAAIAAGGMMAAGGCGNGAEPYVLPKPGPGVIFTYPYDGQLDVPTGTTIVVTFTDAIDTTVLGWACSPEGDGEGDTVSGGFCVRGPDGLIGQEGAVEVAGTRNNVIRFAADTLEPGVTYDVHVSPALVAGGAENLREGEPLLSFTTRQEAMIGGQEATIVAINGDDPEVYRAGSEAKPRSPFLDFSTIRILFSEPIDPVTAILGSTIDVVEVDPVTGAEMPVSGTLVVQGIHASFDPDTDLVPGATYQLRVRPGIFDLGGEPLNAAGEFELTAGDTRTDGALVEQVLMVRSPADGAGSVAGVPANTVSMSHPLLGANQLAAREGAVVAQMGSAEAFGAMIPITIRKGQLVRMGGLAVQLGGVVPTGLDTGDISVSFLSDASGYLVRNPYRDPAQVPDDATSPVFLYLTFDVALTAADPVGNAVLDQTVMNVQATGVGTIAGNALAIETVGAMELDLLGAARAPSNLVLRMETARDGQVPSDTEGPRLVSVYPSARQANAAAGDIILLTFSEAIAPVSTPLGAGMAAISLERVADRQPVASAIMVSGSTVIVKPLELLDYGTSYTVNIGEGLVDLAGNPVVIEGSDPTAGTGVVIIATPPLAPTTPATNLAPVLTALYPGVPCALTGETAESPGRCAGGLAEDSLYRPFVMPADRHVEGYFNQPMAAATLAVGSECGAGTIRIEAVDESGACTAAVTGTFEVLERGFRFYPSRPWVAGQRYRMMLVAGQDASCAAEGEICGLNGEPLNTDPLGGSRARAGGPDIVIPFTGAPASRDTYLAAMAMPVADVNGNGLVDEDVEMRHDVNRGATRITGWGGSVESAEIPEGVADCIPETPEIEGCLYVNAALPVSIDGLASDCQVGVDNSGNPVIVPECIAAEIYPQIIYGTALRLEATIVDSNGNRFMADISTRQLVLRVRENLDSAPRGYIYSDPETGEPRFTANLSLYMDAPDLILIGGVQHDLHSKELELTSTGPVSFTDDGRIQISVANTADVNLSVRIWDPMTNTIDGFIEMQIPRGAMRLQLASSHRQAALLLRRL